MGVAQAARSFLFASSGGECLLWRQEGVAYNPGPNLIGPSTRHVQGCSLTARSMNFMLV